MQNNRILWLDMANVLAMSCVVWFHIPSQMEEPIREWEYIYVLTFHSFCFPVIHMRLAKNRMILLGRIFLNASHTIPSNNYIFHILLCLMDCGRKEFGSRRGADI